MTEEEKDKRFLRNCIIASVGILLVGTIETIGLRMYNNWDAERSERITAERNALEHEQYELKQEEAKIQQIAAEWTDRGITFDEDGYQDFYADKTVIQVLDEDAEVAKEQSETAALSAENTAEIETETKTEEKTEIAEEELFTEINETVYATSNVNIRDNYSTNGNKLGGLSYGQSITRTGIGKGEAANWSRVDFNGKTAYINSKYLSTDKPKETEKTAKVETKANTNKAPKDGDRKTVDGVNYCYLEGFGWVEHSPGGTGIPIEVHPDGVIIGW